MISIRTSIPNLETIKTVHVNFISDYCLTVISFYEEIFNLYNKRNGKTNKIIFQKEILKIKEKHKKNNYKSLLKCFLKKKQKKDTSDKNSLLNRRELEKLVYEDNLCFNFKSVKEIIETLRSLKKNIKKIIEIDFSQDQAKSILLYKGWDSEYEKIAFLIPSILDYDLWFAKLDIKEKWGPYQLALAIDLKSCPYCNRHYTMSLTNEQGKKMGRPDFDHFLPKAKHPLLSLSFFNLIPSCKECNGPSVKGQKSISYETHLSPYEIFATNAFKFFYHPKSYEAMIGNSNDLEIFLTYGGDPKDVILAKKTEGNISLFYLKELYNCHLDVVSDVIRKRYISNDRYLEVLKNTFSDFDVSLEDIYRLAYGGYYFEKDFHKRPLSKLVKDIAIEMEIVKNL